MLPPRDPHTGRFLTRDQQAAQIDAALAVMERELNPPLLTPLDKPIRRQDDGVTALITAAIGGAVLLIVLVVVAVAWSNA